MVFKIDAGRISVIGAGAAGCALTRALYETGLVIDQVISQTLESAQRLASDVGAGQASDRLADLSDGADLIVVSVPDGRITAVADELAALPISWTDRIIMHLSGSRASTDLASLQNVGADVMSFHPMLSLHPHFGVEAFEGARINLEGTPAAVDVGRQLAGRLGAVSIVMDPYSKSALHVAASVASNYLVTLMSVATEILSAAGIPKEDFEALLRPLVARTIENVDFADPVNALTGPISRADRETLEMHFDLLRRLRPEFVTIFADLAAETVRMARRSQRIGDVEAISMLDQIARNVEDTIPDD